ncbi:hypothetical protein HLB23_04705 [Nocardia uniformis]|uniref:Uncharacterized protein n=1 Tax=Nocardia uniformis TaxID=53432 RepID=A0A849BYJ0_9NOCA|nr:hypothetical protein [Nocardia uniformis]NNH69175.1 hypothetical protein [Nocardia uniformis]
MSYRDELKALGKAAGEAAVNIYSRFTAGQLSRDETVEALARLIASANSRAATLADTALAVDLMKQLGTAVPTQGITRPEGDIARLRKASSTVLEKANASPVPEAIIARLARSEALTAAAEAFSEAMRKNRKVKGWVRGVSPNGCQLCEWWWREGRVWPANHPMPTHKGCTCAPKPVVRKSIASTIKTRRMNNAG